MGMQYAKIALLNQSRHTDQLYTYAIPEPLLNQVGVGSRVMVPFGQGNKPYEGFVMNMTDHAEYKRIKKILALPDQEIGLTKEQIDLCEWLASHCYSTLSEALQLVVPTGATFKRQKILTVDESTQDQWPLDEPLLQKLKETTFSWDTLEDSQEKQVKRWIRKEWVRESIEFKTTVKTQFEQRVKLLFDPAELEKRLVNLPKQAVKQQKIMRFMALKQDVSYRTLREALKATKSSLKNLIDMGYIEMYSIEKYREPIQLQQQEEDDFKLLNPEQQRVFEAILSDFSSHQPKTHLLHGITGSGKTEIYMHLVREVVDAGQQAILLVPEISLTPQIVKRFVARFGNRVAILHSKLSLGERYDQWKQIKRGEYPIVIGARSAIFAPCENLGLVIIDEEHESAYKSEQSPRYYTHDVAQFLAEQHRCPLVLGSATPSIETYYKGLKKKYELHELYNRYNNQPLPAVDIIDMREELQLGNRSILSEQLIHALSETMAQKRQAMLFLNRKGFSTFIACRECGYSLRCPNCEISMTYYKGRDYAECKYCGYSEKVTALCPECSSKYYRHFGSGTERIEEEIRNLFPDVNIGRLDSDTTSQKGSLETILEAFDRGETDLLIGTQMIAKGLDFPNVALVGVLSADVLLNLPDYRASERAFQLLTQVAGRTGRGEHPGKVIFQTYTPDHYAIQCAQEHDYEGFFKEEIQLRRSFIYPPYVEMSSLVLSASSEKVVIDYANKLYNRIGTQLQQAGLQFQIYGPSPGIYHRLKSRYRYQIMLKYRKKDQIQAKSIINEACKAMHLETGSLDLVLSVDHKPLNIV